MDLADQAPVQALDACAAEWTDGRRLQVADFAASKHQKRQPDRRRERWRDFARKAKNDAFASWTDAASEKNSNGGVVGRQPVPLSRQKAIRWLREALIKLMDECSRCDTSTEHGIYCLGFRGFTGEELRRRHDSIRNAHPTATPEELEQLARRWELTEQIIQRVPVWCEAHRLGSEACHGWDRFSNEELEQLCSEFLREAVAIMEG